MSVNNRRDSLQDNTQDMLEQVRHEVDQQREPWYHTSRKTRVLILCYFVSFLVFTALALFVNTHPVIPQDIKITREFQEEQAPWLKLFMLGVSALGNYAVVFSLLVVFTALAFWLVNLRLEAIIMLCLPTLSALINMIIKLLVARPRPTSSLVDIFQHATGNSFPSGHVMSYVAYFGLLFSFGVILFKRERWWTYLLLIIPAFFVVTVGPSRIYLGAHWASDVLGAYIIGGALLGITLWIYLILRRNGVLTSKNRRDTPELQKTGTHQKQVNQH